MTTGARIELTGRDDLPEETIHTVLSNERRRLALEHLRAEGETELSTLAERVAVAESGEDPPPSDVRRSVYVSLQQRHVPKLSETGITTYDERSKRVALDGRFDDVAAYMEVVPSAEGLRWLDIYAGLAVLGCSLTTAAALAPLPGGVVPYAVAVFLAIGATGLSQHLSSD